MVPWVEVHLLREVEEALLLLMAAEGANQVGAEPQALAVPQALEVPQALAVPRALEVLRAQETRCCEPRKPFI